jgi:hypothetical protein
VIVHACGWLITPAAGVHDHMDGLGDKLDLDLAIWACFANARLDQEASEEQEYLAA